MTAPGWVGLLACLHRTSGGCCHPQPGFLHQFQVVRSAGWGRGFGVRGTFPPTNGFTVRARVGSGRLFPCLPASTAAPGGDFIVAVFLFLDRFPVVCFAASRRGFEIRGTFSPNDGFTVTAPGRAGSLACLLACLNRSAGGAFHRRRLPFLSAGFSPLFPRVRTGGRWGFGSRAWYLSRGPDGTGWCRLLPCFHLCTPGDVVILE